MKPPTKSTGEAPADSGKPRRAIRSYVLRSGRITAGQRRALEELWPAYGLDNRDSTLNLEREFARPAPCVIEIGFGNGENIIHLATSDQEKNFLGIEVHEPGVGHCMMEAAQRQLSNLRVMCRDAIEVLRNNIPDRSLARVNLFFPDPWHKKRHHKRRIVQAGFVDLVGDKLQPAGIFHVVTDWPDYAEHIAAVMSANSRFSLMDQAPSDRVTTRFDSRGARLGHDNWERAWCKHSKN